MDRRMRQKSTIGKLSQVGWEHELQLCKTRLEGISSNGRERLSRVPEDEHAVDNDPMSLVVGLNYPPQQYTCHEKAMAHGSLLIVLCISVSRRGQSIFEAAGSATEVCEYAAVCLSRVR